MEPAMVANPPVITACISDLQTFKNTVPTMGIVTKVVLFPRTVITSGDYLDEKNYVPVHFISLYTYIDVKGEESVAVLSRNDAKGRRGNRRVMASML